MSTIELYRDLLNESDDELKSKMVEYEAKQAPVTAKLCQDILILRRHEDLIRQTKELVKQTWWVAIATWALAVTTIIISIFAKK